MSNQDTESSGPIVERLLPQTSIQFFVFLIGVSALVMYTFRSAIVGDQFWAKCASVVIATMMGCFVTYLLLFLIASLFSMAAATISRWPIRRASVVAAPDLVDDGNQQFKAVQASAGDAHTRDPDSLSRESGESL